ncbi:efflux RND transporter periplasmic adaptor subunit [Bowmanella sp. Y26]|uniref:efflux RND transporter periplasmic adaptor subunit n=1 Tax=Bowmanella yangjiangensis TaxID=2811230 RepID=UPI001BDD3F59|nr:efflux RND transporter periplasmic adaptor subunit [Bowmanella yangjiangensis]MBT1063552.1 efflux RND transporter periplasmic adaptor subunit [Bowmanella yangjiangensis]
MKHILRSLIVTVLLASALTLSVVASPDHGVEKHVEPDTGPQGGRWLEQGELALEVVIYEAGLPAEMRVYPYVNGQLISPLGLSLQVQLHRLGGEIQSLSFEHEGPYLVSRQEVTEPHSFEVDIEAGYQGKVYTWHYDSPEGRTELSDRAIKLAKIGTAVAGPGDISSKDKLFGVITPTIDRRFSLMAPYPGVVEALLVQVGEQVKLGQPLMRVRNSQTLKSYSVNSPANGVVTEQFANAGELAGNQVLMEVADLSKVWVELSAFPENIERLRIGQRALVKDLHQHLQAEGEVFYIAPMMSAGHIARARLLIDNADGHWRPGMHVKADVITEQRQAPVRIERQAIQQLGERSVVFVQVGNTFEARPVELGLSDNQWVEVLSGLSAGMQYVTANSFVLKADVLKAGASHAH